MKVVVVESPAKAKTINKYLGDDYEVLASFGHVRDLPAKDGSVDPDADFAMIWELEGRGAKQVSEIARAVKGAQTLILATDPDREGEAISWHVLDALRARRALKDVEIQRVTFNAITRDAVREAMARPRQIDQALVDAYLARRALDYLVGFRLSPVLWRKLPGARSAGRVQSVALRLVCDREREIEAFRPREYWSIVALLRTARRADRTGGQDFEARLVGADGKKIGRLDVGTGDEAAAFKRELEKAAFEVLSVEAKPAKRHPQPPFTTSTLQQEASRKLGMAPARAMQVAQRLYEGVDIGGETVGLITYMRTDGVDMAGEAIAAARRVIGREFGEDYVPAAPRKYTVKAKNAQEAHEAIRPTDLGRLPAMVARHVDQDQARLYELIWMRTIASQMQSAELERTTIDIQARTTSRSLDLRATGQVVKFDGFLRVYQEGKDDDEDEENRRLPAMKPGDAPALRDIKADQHFTDPPPRYSEASLVKRMEELGIGRPSTYASVLQVLKDREYVAIDKKKLIPSDKGMLVTAFLESFFRRYVEYDFTASLEGELDRVSNAEIDWKDVLRAFWRDFSAAIDGTKELRTAQVLDALNEFLGAHVFPKRADGANPRACPSCGGGTLSLKLGKFGAFIGCSNYPNCKYTRQLSSGAQAENSETPAASGPRVLGVDPASGLEVTARDGRFGPYLQLGDGEKPKRASLPKGVTPANVDLETALALLSLPREVAKHPTTGKPILAGIGRFGPYVQHDRTYANLDKGDEVLTIGANRAIDLIVARETAGPRARFGRAAADSGRALGDHPDGGAVTLRDGRYGPYVSHGKLNATLPKGLDAAALTLDQAIALLKAKEASGGGAGRKPARSAARRGAEKSKQSDAAAPKSAVGKPAGSKTAAVKSGAAAKRPAKSAGPRAKPA